jgi:hypothetical protein
VEPLVRIRLRKYHLWGAPLSFTMHVPCTRAGMRASVPPWHRPTTPTTTRRMCLLLYVTEANVDVDDERTNKRTNFTPLSSSSMTGQSRTFHRGMQPLSPIQIRRQYIRPGQVVRMKGCLTRFVLSSMPPLCLTPMYSDAPPFCNLSTTIFVVRRHRSDYVQPPTASMTCDACPSGCPALHLCLTPMYSDAPPHLF